MIRATTQRLAKIGLRLIVVLIVMGLVSLVVMTCLAARRTIDSLTARPAQFATTFKPQSRYLFPDGTQKLFPGQRLVALYGVPDVPVLGAAGEQSLQQTIGRTKQLAAEHQAYSGERIVPTLEIIATIAADSPTENNDYSREQDSNALHAWIVAAQQQGVYVVLDLQPGRSDFLAQAKQYERLLCEPNVGLALDPEWRLAPNQKPLEQIGSVSIEEVNATATWLAALTAKHRLPQKLFLLHQFRLSMIDHREALDTTHPELAYVIQMDGQGPQDTKADTWRVITAQPPTNTVFGWKNFYAKDTPVLDPPTTMQIVPQPWYISYQ